MTISAKSAVPPRLLVIQFPGSNCDYETARAARAAGFDAVIRRWTISEAEFHSYDAYILPGGFSYQDRVRAGVMSSKLPIVSFLMDASREGKLILGICNGCQILAESGLLPDISGDTSVQMALAHNTRGAAYHGFVCDWVAVRADRPERSVFGAFLSDGDVLPIPINHGEGRFVFSKNVDLSEVFLLRYCSPSGEIDHAYPVNPNGSAENVAALTNRAGNVMAMMPHPERAFMLRQVPLAIDSPWAERKRMAFSTGEDGNGPWFGLFESMRVSISGNVIGASE